MRTRVSNKRLLLVVSTCCCVLVALAIGLSVTSGSQGGMGRVATQTLAQSSAAHDVDKDVDKAADKSAGKDADKDVGKGAGQRADNDVRKDAGQSAGKGAAKGAAGSADSGSSGVRNKAVGDAADKGADGGVGARGSSADNELDGDAAEDAGDMPGVSVDGAGVPDVPLSGDADGRARTASPTGTTAVELVDEPVFTIPGGAEYVPEEVLVTVDKGIDSVRLATQLKKSGARTVDVDSAQWITDDVVRLNVRQGSTVEDAVNELLLSGAALDAQPNYLYTVDDSMTPGQIALRAMRESAAADDASDLAGDGSKAGGATDVETTDVIKGQDDVSEDGSTALVEEDEKSTEGLDPVGGEDSESPRNAGVEDPVDNEGGAEDVGDKDVLVNEEAVDDGDAADDIDGKGDLVNEDAVVDGDSREAKGALDSKNAVELVDDEGIVVEAESDADDAVVVDETADADAESAVTTQASTVTDPFFVKGFQWGLKSIRAPEVWEQEATASMQKVGVAVLDCGFDVTHPDIKNVIAPGSAYNAYRASVNKEDENGIPLYTDDELADVASGSSSPIPGVGHYDHGMHVSGVIAAQRNNFEGIAGVADNVQLVPVRVYDYSDTTPQAPLSALVKGMDYAIQNQDAYNIRVINLSVGTRWATAISSSDALCKKIDEAYSKGIVTVCSAGNEGATGSYINYPSDWGTAVGVINLKNDTYKASEDSTSGYKSATCLDPLSVVRFSTSNFNMGGETCKNIAAPGTEILSATDYSQTLIDRAWKYYMFDTGTSMSTPHVVGVLALMFGKTSVPKTAAGAQHMVDALYGSARHVKESVPFEQEYGHGEVDALGAWNALEQPYVDGPSYIKVGQSGVTYALKSDKSSASSVTSGWSFSSSNADVLQINASTGACTAKKSGTTTIVATRNGQTVTKDVAVFGDGIEGSDVVFFGSSDKYVPMQPASFSWSWGAKGTNIEQSGVKFTSAGVLTAGSIPIKVSLSATLSVSKDSDVPVILNKNVYVVGALSGGGTMAQGETKTLSLDMPEGLSLSSSELVWGSNDESIATVKNGVVTAKLGGKTSIWVAPKDAVSTDANGKTYVVGSMYQSVDITVTDSIARTEIKVSGLGSRTYTGSAIKPAPVLTCGSKTLVRGTDYSIVSYANNVKVGTASIELKGKGCFAGTTRTVTFKIVPAKISSAKAAAIAKQAYTGKLVKPKPKLTFGGATLKLGTDYALSYENNKKAGTATVVVTGKGNFKGTKSVSFKIVAPTVNYHVYVEGKGWQAWVKNGKTSGLVGKSKRAEAVGIKVTTLPVTGGVTYRAYVQGSGWQAWKSNGAAAGLANKGKRLEAVQVKLTGKLAKLYNVQYRTYRQRDGWTKWVKNGASSGTAKSGLRIEALQVKLVPKG